MTDTILPNKSLTEPAIGGDANQWGNILNGDLVNIDSAFGGTTTLTSTSGPVLLTATQYIPPNIVVTGATTDITYRIPSGVGGQWSIFNNTAYNVTWATNAGGSPTTVTIPAGLRKSVISNGTDISPTVSTSTLTFNDSGTGGASPVVYNNTAAQTISYNTLGALGTGSFTGANQLLAATGYQKIPGGLIIQWGVLPAQTDSGYHAETFTGLGGIVFPTACVSLQLQVYQNSQNTGIAGANTSVVSVEGLTALGFNYIMSSNWDIGPDTGVPLYWLALGY
jgi:hypothetical protein